MYGIQKRDKVGAKTFSLQAHPQNVVQALSQSRRELSLRPYSGDHFVDIVYEESTQADFIIAQKAPNPWRSS